MPPACGGRINEGARNVDVPQSLHLLRGVCAQHANLSKGTKKGNHEEEYGWGDGEIGLSGGLARWHPAGNEVSR